MKNQTYRMTMLYDFYGELLTERQKEFFDLYYNEDLSLSEIAENSGISRQGVRDVIVRAEGIMQEIEDKTGLIRRFMQMQGNLNAIQEAAEELKTINYRQYENPRVDALVDTIMKAATALLPSISLHTDEDPLIGKTSGEAMRLGLLTGTAMMVDGFIDRFLAMKDMAGARIIATGGSAELATVRCSHSILQDRDLTLKGLLRLYQLNQPRRP